MILEREKDILDKCWDLEFPRRYIQFTNFKNLAVLIIHTYKIKQKENSQILGIQLIKQQTDIKNCSKILHMNSKHPKRKII